ncbi:MAG: hypothetical protein AB4206_00200 [Xenococcaceae cyanobacterium]
MVHKNKLLHSQHDLITILEVQPIQYKRLYHIETEFRQFYDDPFANEDKYFWLAQYRELFG